MCMKTGLGISSNILADLQGGVGQELDELWTNMTCVCVYMCDLILVQGVKADHLPPLVHGHRKFLL